MKVQSFKPPLATPQSGGSRGVQTPENIDQGGSRGVQTPENIDQGGSRGVQSPENIAQGVPEKDWALFFYLNGNNATVTQAVTNLRQLEFVNGGDKLHLIAQLARPESALDQRVGDWSGVRRYEIKHNGQKLEPATLLIDGLTGFLPGKTKGIKSPVLQELDKSTDMGQAQTLQDFLEWGIEKFPSKRIMVVLCGPSEGISGMMQDEVSGSKMSVAELGQTFRGVQQKTGRSIDVLTLNGSATNSLEVACELDEHVKYLVGSQGIQQGQSIPLAMVLNEVANVSQDGPLSPLAMAQYILLLNSMAPGSLSIVDLEKIAPAQKAWNILSQTLLAGQIDRNKLNDILKRTQNFQGASKNSAYGNSRDAIHFAKLVQSEIQDPQIKAAANQAIESLEAALQGDAASGKHLEEANGISIFAPSNMGFIRPEEPQAVAESLRDADYHKTKFAQETHWDELLRCAARDSRLNRALKTVGVDEVGLDRAHAFYGNNIGKVDAAMSLAGLAGFFNGINAWRGADPSGFLLLGPQAAVYAGVAGAGGEALKALGRIGQGATQLKDRDEVAGGTIDLLGASAKGVANLGFLLPELQPYAPVAGMAMVFSPWLSSIYGIYDQYQQLKDGTELGQVNLPETQRWATAAYRYRSQQDLQDHSQRSVWQKMAG